MSRCRGAGSGTHGYFREVDMIAASTVLRDDKARGFYCVECARVRGCINS